MLCFSDPSSELGAWVFYRTHNTSVTGTPNTGKASGTTNTGIQVPIREVVHGRQSRNPCIKNVTRIIMCVREALLQLTDEYGEI
jgi:hypothetical protein